MNIGLIAGGGRFPLLFARAAKTAGHGVYAVAYTGQADPAIQDAVDAAAWLNVGQVERLLEFFSRHQVTDAVIMGWVRKTVMFSDFQPDDTALAFIAGLTETHDDLLLRSFAGLLEENGLRVRASTFLLPHILAGEGCWTKAKPTAGQWSDISLGWRIAKEIGRLDVGQCVVVQKGSVLAVEAIEGTDAAIARGGGLGGGDAVVVKVCKPNQDLRFDMPAVGMETVRTMQSAGATVLAVEAGRSVVFDKPEMIKFADANNMSVVALTDKDASLS
ncbi:MAG: UDP-2,3-diacylglucosamine diphosphatase LpxI [Thermodesulfobacteriota bacterium]|nr:UDP-2,3-diacylglucosamine diphosphatase LpxI [Thermodesulfobacteriota bacterium]